MIELLGPAIETAGRAAAKSRNTNNHPRATIQGSSRRDRKPSRRPLPDPHTLSHRPYRPQRRKHKYYWSFAAAAGGNQAVTGVGGKNDDSHLRCGCFPSRVLWPLLLLSAMMLALQVNPSVVSLRRFVGLLGDVNSRGLRHQQQAQSVPEHGHAVVGYAHSNSGGHGAESRDGVRHSGKIILKVNQEKHQVVGLRKFLGVSLVPVPRRKECDITLEKLDWLYEVICKASTRWPQSKRKYPRVNFSKLPLEAVLECYLGNRATPSSRGNRSFVHNA